MIVCEAQQNGLLGKTILSLQNVIKKIHKMLSRIEAPPWNVFSTQ